MAVTLTLDAETVRMFAQKARAAATTLDDRFESGGDQEIVFNADTLTGDSAHDELAEEEAGDLSAEELVELIDDLNVDEAADLVAIVWLGRGDFEAADFASARDEAQGRAVGPTSSYLARMPMLADHLEAGLDALGL